MRPPRSHTLYACRALSTGLAAVNREGQLMGVRTSSGHTTTRVLCQYWLLGHGRCGSRGRPSIYGGSEDWGEAVEEDGGGQGSVGRGWQGVHAA